MAYTGERKICPSHVLRLLLVPYTSTDVYTILVDIGLPS